MDGPKRTKFQREADRERITAMYLRGMPQSAIAAKVGVTQQQVSLDLKIIQARWRESTTLNLDEAKGKELAKIDELERTYWEAWTASQGIRKRTTTETNGDKVDKKSIVHEKMLGNPAYLTGVQSCIDSRCKLLGLYAPVKTETKIDVTKLSDAELLAIIQE